MLCGLECRELWRRRGGRRSPSPGWRSTAAAPGTVAERAASVCAPESPEILRVPAAGTVSSTVRGFWGGVIVAVAELRSAAGRRALPGRSCSSSRGEGREVDEGSVDWSTVTDGRTREEERRARAAARWVPVRAPCGLWLCLARVGLAGAGQLVLTLRAHRGCRCYTGRAAGVVFEEARGVRGGV